MKNSDFKHIVKESIREAFFTEIKEGNSEILKESMYLYIKGARLDRDLSNLHYVCSQLTDDVLNPIINKLPEDQKNYFKKNGVGFYETIVPDGSFYQGTNTNVGIINVYISGFTTHTMREILKEIFSHLRKWNIKWKFPKIENSGVYKSKVLRIPIVKNDSKKENFPPSLNLSNVNAYQIFHNVLQYEGEHQFHMKAKELMERIESLAHDQGWIDKNIIKPTDSDWPKDEYDPQDVDNPHLDVVNQLGGQPGGARMIGGGLSGERIRDRLKEIWQIAKWADDRGFEDLYVA